MKDKCLISLDRQKSTKMWSNALYWLNSNAISYSFWNIYSIPGGKKAIFAHLKSAGSCCQLKKSEEAISSAIQLSNWPLTTSSLSGADRLDGVCRLSRIQEGDVGLWAHSVHWPVLPIGQTHVLFAVGQLSGQKLAEKDAVNQFDFSQCETAGKDSYVLFSASHCFTLHKLFSAFQRWK